MEMDCVYCVQMYEYKIKIRIECHYEYKDVCRTNSSKGHEHVMNTKSLLQTREEGRGEEKAR